MVDAIDCFCPYLRAILTGSKDSTYRDWQEFYLPTQAELPLRVQTGLPSEALSRSREEKREQIEVLTALRKYASGHALIVGKPGSGKSTSLKRLCWEEARRCWEAQEPRNSEALQIPVFLELRGFQDNSVLQLIQRSLRQGKLRLSEAEIEDLLFDGRLLLLFDGLNELPSDEAWCKVDEFRQEYADIPMIFSTRELGAGASWGIEKKLEMMPLTERQMRQFIEKRLPGQAEALLGQIHDRLRELAETPLLLKMLCDVFDQKGQIPKNRGELFRKEFARRYEEFKPLRGCISEDSRRFAPELLQYLAFTMIQGDPHSDPCKPTASWLTISKTKAEQILAVFLAGGREPDWETKAKAKEWLEDLVEHHLLQVASNPNEIEFHHQLFQEYYAAEWLLLQLSTLNDEQLKYYFLNYLKWTEAIGLMLGLPEVTEEQALEIVELALNEVDWMLGARLAGEVQQDWQARAVTSVIEEARQQQVSSTREIQLLGNTHSDYAASVLLTKFTDEEEQDLLLESAFALRELGSRSPVQQLLLILRNGKPFIATITLLILGKVGDEKIIPDLQKALSHPDDNVREQAAGALGELGNDIVVPDLLNALKDGSYKVREKSVEALGDLRNKLAIPELLKIALEDQTIHLPWMAAEALKKIHQERATEELLKALKDKNYKIRGRAAKALGKIGGETAIDGLLEALEDNHIDWQVAGALVEIGSKKALPGLLKALEGSIPSEQAAFVLGELGDALAVPNLINVLNHWHLQVRERAVEALGKLGDEAAIPRLYELLQNNLRDDLRKMIIVALGKLGDERVRPELIKMLDNQAFGSSLVWSGQWQVFDALERIGGQPVIQALKQAMGANNAQIRWKAAEVLGNLGNEVAIDSLLTALTDENSTVRWESAKALGKFDSKHVMPILSPLLKHDDLNIREAAVQVLGYLEDEAAVAALLDALDDSELNVRYDAVQSLVKLSNSKVKLFVSKALSHPWKEKLLNDGFIYAVQNLQENCQFYNYAIAQSDPPPAVQPFTPKDPASVTMIFQAPVYGAAGTVQGDQIINPPMQNSPGDLPT